MRLPLAPLLRSTHDRAFEPTTSRPEVDDDDDDDAGGVTDLLRGLLELGNRAAKPPQTFRQHTTATPPRVPSNDCTTTPHHRFPSSAYVPARAPWVV